MKAIQWSVIPVRALRVIASVISENHARDATGEAWRDKTADEHYDHLQAHLIAWRMGERDEPHLFHAGARLLFLLECAIDGQQRDGYDDGGSV